MPHLPNLTNTPPGGWRYTVPETGIVRGPFSGWHQLYDDLKSHYQATGYKIPENIFDLVEQSICKDFPEYCGAPTSFIQRVGNALKSMGHTFNAAHRCLITLVSHRAGSGERPSQQQINARAEVCASCPMNQDLEFCSTCNIATLNRLVQKIAGSMTTPFDAQLKSCAVCHCNLKAKIATKHEAIWNFMPEDQKKLLPETCWIKTEFAAKEKLYESVQK